MIPGNQEISLKTEPKTPATAAKSHKETDIIEAFKVSLFLIASICPNNFLL